MRYSTHYPYVIWRVLCNYRNNLCYSDRWLNFLIRKAVNNKCFSFPIHAFNKIECFKTFRDKTTALTVQGREKPMATKLSYSLFKDLSLVYLLFVRDKTMNDKLMYIPNNEIQNETSFVKMFGHCYVGTYKFKFNKSTQSLKANHKD